MTIRKFLASHKSYGGMGFPDTIYGLIGMASTPLVSTPLQNASCRVGAIRREYLVRRESSALEKMVLIMNSHLALVHHEVIYPIQFVHRTTSNSNKLEQIIS